MKMVSSAAAGSGPGSRRPSSPAPTTGLAPSASQSLPDSPRPHSHRPPGASPAWGVTWLRDLWVSLLGKVMRPLSGEGVRMEGALLSRVSRGPGTCEAPQKTVLLRGWKVCLVPHTQLPCEFLPLSHSLNIHSDIISQNHWVLSRVVRFSK